MTYNSKRVKGTPFCSPFEVGQLEEKDTKQFLSRFPVRSNRESCRNFEIISTSRAGDTSGATSGPNAKKFRIGLDYLGGNWRGKSKNR